MSFSNFLETEVLDHVFGGNAYTAPGTLYLALFTTDNTDTGGGTEVSGGAYARQTASFPTASGTGGSVSTDADITFPTATGSWGTVTHIGIWDASSGGNLLYHTALDSSKTIDSGDIFKITSGNLTVTLA